jgi:hypothetical protein
VNEIIRAPSTTLEAAWEGKTQWELFLFRMAGPRETSLCNLGFRRAKGIMDQSERVPFHRLLPKTR